MKKLVNNINGFGLIEVTIIIITIGILASIAMQSMTSLMTDARQVRTEREMETLASAIVGESDLSAGAMRSDFGYVGDIGSFPPNLDALISNPGGYATWDGPYISTEFTQDVAGYKTDEWGTAYSYSGGTTINSTGSGSTISKKIADATTDYTLNNFNGIVIDGAGSVPGTTYLDSLDITVTIPNGSGGTIVKNYLVDSSGSFILDSVPVGQHPLRVIYIPNVDTLYSVLTILPRHKTPKTYKFASAYFISSGGGGGSNEFIYIDGTGQATGATCNDIQFNLQNNTDSTIIITSITPSWSSSTSFYKELFIGGNLVFDNANPRNGTGQIVNFSGISITSGSIVSILIEEFKVTATGGANADMGNIDFSFILSDGTTFNFNTGTCN